MTPPWNLVEKLHPDHDLSAFECGLESVDEWLQTKAMPNRSLVGTHLCVSESSDVVAFFALKTIIVPTEGMSSRLRAGSSEGQSTGILLCQMGLAKSLQANGHGKALLRLAVTEALEAHRRSPVQLFVVDAENEDLVRFYEKPGLQRIPNSLRLLAPMKSLEKAFPRG
jgi:GNAT superfamily N-acetyltransferase